MPGALASVLTEIVGAAHVLADPDVMASYTVDWTRRWAGPAALVVRPGSTGEVAAVVAACHAHHVPIVPQGGNTGLVGGSVPGRALDAGRDERDGAGSGRPGAAAGTLPVVVSLRRLGDIDPVDVTAGQITAGAGVPLVRLQAAAEAAGLAFAVDLAARDTATIGGMCATNAGGIHVLRYGGMREQVLGVEAVLADGRVISRLDGLIKDNTGYHLSGLLIGSEGTLGLVTRARLRLVALLRERVTALIGVTGTADALCLLGSIMRQVGSLQAAEIFYPEGLDLVQHHAGLPPPLPRRWGAYVLIECADHHDPSDDLARALEAAPVALADDATAVASDAGGMAALWAYRERHTEAVSSLGVPHKMDVTVPLSRMADFEGSVRGLVAEIAPAAQVILWGHIGDGNLHVNVVGPAPDDERVDDAVLRLVAGLGGSISAEHGIGRAKLPWLGLTRSAGEIDAMKSIKAALDPEGLLNPGVLIPLPGLPTG
jgi:FAD/FMN-containing dehydrogenase